MTKKIALLGLFIFLLGGFFIMPGISQARPCPGSGDWEDRCESEDPPSGEYVEQLGTMKYVEAGLSSDGEDKSKLFLFIFPGNAGQIYRVDYVNRRNDNPTPGITACINGTSVMWQGVCKTFQYFKSGREETSGTLQIGTFDYNFYGIMVVKLDVDQTTFNQNDVVAGFTMHRREFTGFESGPNNNAPNIKTGTAPNFSWDSSGHAVRRVLFMEGPSGGSWDDGVIPIDATGGWSLPSTLGQVGTYDFQLEFEGPARYGGSNRAVWNTQVTVSNDGANPPGGGPGEGPGRFRCGGHRWCKWYPGESGGNQCNNDDDCDGRNKCESSGCVYVADDYSGGDQCGERTSRRCGGTPEPDPQCRDGRDNDGDGLVDHPGDPGCDNPNDNSESPNPGPTQPNVAVQGGGGCTEATSYSANFSWSGWRNPSFGYWVDISTDPGFGSYSNKNVPNGNATDSSGFNPPLTLQPDVTYYVRIYNGVHSPTASFTLPYCRHNVCHLVQPVSQCVRILGRGTDECGPSMPPCPPPPPECTVNMSPNRLVIPPPQTATITWSCPPGPPVPSSCTLTGYGNVGSSGQVTINPTSTRSYSITCTNESGSDTETVTVRMFNMNASGTIKEIPPQ